MSDHYHYDRYNGMDKLFNTDCISRQAVITQLSHNKNKGDEEWELAVANDIETVWKLPPVTPKQRTGKWIHVSEEMWKCDQCGEISCCSPRYCPDCGSRNEVTE